MGNFFDISKSQRWATGVAIAFMTFSWIHGLVCVCILRCFSHIWLFATLWVEAHKTPLSMGFSRQGYWSELPCPPPEDLPDPEIKPASLWSLYCWATREAWMHGYFVVTAWLISGRWIWIEVSDVTSVKYFKKETLCSSFVLFLVHELNVDIITGLFDQVPFLFPKL